MIPVKDLAYRRLSLTGHAPIQTSLGGYQDKVVLGSNLRGILNRAIGWIQQASSRTQVESPDSTIVPGLLGLQILVNLKISCLPRSDGKL